MSPRNTHQVTPEGAVHVQEVVTHPDLIARSGTPQQVRSESGRETCIAKVLLCGLHILDAQASVISPFHFIAEADRRAESPIVEEIFRRAEISAHQLWR